MRFVSGGGGLLNLAHERGNSPEGAEGGQDSVSAVVEAVVNACSPQHDHDVECVRRLGASLVVGCMQERKALGLSARTARRRKKAERCPLTKVALDAWSRP